MLFFRVQRSQVSGPVLVLSGSFLGFLVLGCLVSGCAAHDRTVSSWMTLQLTPESSGMIDPSIVVVQATSEQRATAQRQLVAGGFDVRDGASLEVRRKSADQADFANDLIRLSDLYPGAVHLVVQRGDDQRCEVGDAIVITPRDPAKLSALLARHHLQLPQIIITPMVRAVTQPRDDLLHLNERITALRADPDIIQADFDLITHATLK